MKNRVLHINEMNKAVQIIILLQQIHGSIKKDRASKVKTHVGFTVFAKDSDIFTNLTLKFIRYARKR